MLHVRVEQEDIDQGEMGSPTSCPVAQATVRAAYRDRGVAHAVRCGYASISIGLDTYDLPAAVTEWIHRFDRRAPVAPVEFDLQERREQA